MTHNNQLAPSAGPALARTSVVQQVDGLLTSPIDDELVMMDLASNHYYGLNPISTHIWQQLALPCSLTTLCLQLQQEFEVDAQTCQQDVIQFVQQLLAAGLVKVAAGGDEGVTR